MKKKSESDSPGPHSKPKKFSYLCGMKELDELAVTVYCGSSAHLAPIYLESAAELGRALAARGVTLVSGAGHSGLMGAVADAAIAAGGRTHGVIPQFMVDRGWNHAGMDVLDIVPDMHTRKARMAELAYGCIAMPGGVGTFEELMEIITWRQLGLFRGNVVILNINDYYAPLLSLFHQGIQEGFIPADHFRLFSVASSVGEAVEFALAPCRHIKVSPKF